MLRPRHQFRCKFVLPFSDTCPLTRAAIQRTSRLSAVTYASANSNSRIVPVFFSMNTLFQHIAAWSIFQLFKRVRVNVRHERRVVADLAKRLTKDCRFFRRASAQHRSASEQPTTLRSWAASSCASPSKFQRLVRSAAVASCAPARTTVRAVRASYTNSVLHACSQHTLADGRRRSTTYESRFIRLKSVSPRAIGSFANACSSKTPAGHLAVVPRGRVPVRHGTNSAQPAL